MVSFLFYLPVVITAQIPVNFLGKKNMYVINIINTKAYWAEIIKKKIKKHELLFSV